jgi:DNA-binding MarR family transcriptional regulator
MDPKDSLGYQVNHLSRLLAQSLRDRIAPYGVVPGQFAQLLALFERDEVTQNELCDEVGIDQSTMAHTLKRMERDGLIERSPDTADRRRAVIGLTPKARGLEDRLVEAAQATNTRATRGFTDDERDLALRLVARMIANLSNEDEPPC